MFAVPASVGTTHAAPELRQRRMWIETDFRDTVVGDTVALLGYASAQPGEKHRQHPRGLATRSQDCATPTEY